jgi:RNA polymerase II-associated protein 2
MTSFLDCLGEGNPSEPDQSHTVPASDQQKSNALRYAQNIQFQKIMQERVLDLLINTVDLPSYPATDPTRPLASDAALFKQALTLFQPKDFDDMILERNIYEKCAYALCPRPNLKQNREMRDRTFRHMKQARKFRMNTKEDLEKWCSVECAERALFVRLQLSTEPAWLRSTPVENISLLEESKEGAPAEDLTGTMQELGLEEHHSVDVASSLQRLALDQSKKRVVDDRMQALSLERGANDDRDKQPLVVTGVKERNSLSAPSAPQSSPNGNDLVEGYKPSIAQSCRQYRSENDVQDTEMSR